MADLRHIRADPLATPAELSFDSAVRPSILMAMPGGVQCALALEFTCIVYVLDPETAQLRNHSHVAQLSPACMTPACFRPVTGTHSVHGMHVQALAGRAQRPGVWQPMRSSTIWQLGT